MKFYFKVPRWFHIDTPIGRYTPDWAVVFEDDSKLYLVAETKSGGELRDSESLKIECGKKHFAVLDAILQEEIGESGAEYRRINVEEKTETAGAEFVLKTLSDMAAA